MYGQNYFSEMLNIPSGPATFIQRLPNMFQTPWTFGTRWVIVVQTSLVHWVDHTSCLGNKEDMQERK